MDEAAFKDTFPVRTESPGGSSTRDARKKFVKDKKEYCVHISGLSLSHWSLLALVAIRVSLTSLAIRPRFRPLTPVGSYECSYYLLCHHLNFIHATH